MIRAAQTTAVAPTQIGDLINSIMPIFMIMMLMMIMMPMVKGMGEGFK